VSALVKDKNRNPLKRRVNKKVIYPSSRQKRKKGKVNDMDDFHKKLVESTIRYQNNRLDAPGIGEFIEGNSGKTMEKVEKVVLKKRDSHGSDKTMAVAKAR
jgi:hypothetical protein